MAREQSYVMSERDQRALYDMVYKYKPSTLLVIIARRYEYYAKMWAEERGRSKYEAWKKVFHAVMDAVVRLRKVEV